MISFTLATLKQTLVIKQGPGDDLMDEEPDTQTREIEQSHKKWA